MLWILASLLAALGVYVFLARRSASSWLIGSQLIFMSLTTFFVHAGVARGERTETQLGAFYVVILGTVFAGTILGLATRYFFLNRGVKVDRTELS